MEHRIAGCMQTRETIYCGIREHANINLDNTQHMDKDPNANLGFPANSSNNSNNSVEKGIALNVEAMLMVTMISRCRNWSFIRPLKFDKFGTCVFL